MTALTMTNVETFISYARKDGLSHAQHLEQSLPNTWRDKRDIDPAKDFSAEIENAIDRCAQVIACITPDALREDSFVRRELARASRKKKPIIVVRFADIDPPIIVETNTWIDHFRQEDWSTTLNEISRWIKHSVPNYTPPASHDPYQEYLNQLYDLILAYLDRDRVVIKEVQL